MPDVSNDTLLAAITALRSGLVDQVHHLERRVTAIERAEWRCPFFPDREEDGHKAIVRLDRLELSLTKAQTVVIFFGAMIAGTGAIGGILKAIEAIQGLIGS